jgi:glycerol kinase
MSILAIDAGTTGVTALVVGEDARVLARGYEEFPQHFPTPGWVEHEPEQIWQATLSAARQALDRSDQAPTAIGITNQRETAVLWDRDTLAAPRRAVVWQDRRSAAICDELRDAGHEDRVRELTGLRFDPYFTGTKLRWLAENDQRSWQGVTEGSVLIGTVDSYLVARLTAGARHVTDASNASRTLLFDITTGAWSDELCELIGVPRNALPEVVPSYGEVGRSIPAAFLGLDLPIAGIAGDQQAALFGQACYEVGDSKCTYGTGSFVLVNTGAELVRLGCRAADDRGLDGPVGHADLRARGRNFRYGRSDSVVARRPGSDRFGGRVGGARLNGAGQRWRRLRAGVDGARRARLGSRSARHHPRHHARHHARPPRTRHPRGHRVRGTRRRRDVARDHDAASRRWCSRQRAAAPAAGQPARAAGRATRGAGDDGARRGVPGGARHGCLVVDRRACATWRLDRRFEPTHWAHDDATGGRDGAYRRWRAAVERAKGWATE